MIDIMFRRASHWTPQPHGSSTRDRDTSVPSIQTEAMQDLDTLRNPRTITPKSGHLLVPSFHVHGSASLGMSVALDRVQTLARGLAWSTLSRRCSFHLGTLVAGLCSWHLTDGRYEAVSAAVAYYYCREKKKESDNESMSCTCKANMDWSRHDDTPEEAGDRGVPQATSMYRTTFTLPERDLVLYLR